MRTAFRAGCVALFLAAQAPAVALAAQPRTPPGKKAPDAKAPPKKQPMDDDTAIVMLIVLGAVVVLGGGGFVAWRLLSRPRAGKGDGRAPEPLLAERKYDWETRLTADQEAAMLRGVQAYRDGGHSLYLAHREALITFYEPRMLVSLHRLTDTFLAAGPPAVADPVGVMRSVLDGFVAAESPGVLHLTKDWYMASIEGYDPLKFTNLCYDLLTRPQPHLEGTQGSSADENSGSMTLNVEVGGPMSTFCVDLRRVVALVQQAHTARPSDPIVDLVRPVLQGMCRGEIPGGMWTRGAATPAEIDLSTRVLATSAPRPS